MAGALQWTTFERTNGVSSFEFAVVDLERAFDALKDIPNLVFAGTAPVYTFPKLTYTRGAYLAYASIGFIPRSKNYDPLIPELVSGNAGEVGARYRYHFAIHEDSDGDDAVVQTEIMEIVDEGDRKEIVLHNYNEFRRIPENKWGCKPFPLESETETRFLLYVEDGESKVKFSHNGAHPVRNVEVRGRCISYFETIAASLFCPCCIPCIADDVYMSNHTLHPFLSEQLWELKEYCNTYDPESFGERYQRPERLFETREKASNRAPVHSETTVEIPVAVPIVGPEASGVESSEKKTEQLRKWHSLFKSGAITAEEYEREKAKVLQS